MKSMTPLVAVGKARITPTWRHLCLVTSMVIVLFTTFVTVAPASAATPSPHGGSKTYTGTPNTVKATLQIPRPSVPLPGPKQPIQHKTPTPSAATAPTAQSVVPSVASATLALSPTQAVHVTTPDGRIDLTVPVGAITAADMASPTSHPDHVTFTQIAPASGSTDGGHLTLGTFLIQIQDSTGKELHSGMGLRQPLTLIYHWPTTLTGIPLTHIMAVINQGVVPRGITAAHIGTPTTAAMPYNSASHTLSAVVPLTASSTPLSFDTNAPVATFGKADDWHADLNVGGLSDELPLDIPSGPGSLQPPVHLTYSSAAVDANHGWQAASSWVGEGWNLDLGAITWSQHNRGSCLGCAAQWESTWQMSDPYGTSATLVPPNVNIDTYYDNTGNAPSADKATWHTAPYSAVNIISYTNPVPDCVHFPEADKCTQRPANYAVQPPCFRAWLPNGIMEEFGCTPDSLQYYPAGGSGNQLAVSAWKLDLITDPNGNQIHFTYTADMETNPNLTTQTYPRDIALSSITWDSPSCHDANTQCTGTAWQPLFQLSFNTENGVIHPSGGTCGTPTDHTRCDDAPGTATIPAPLVESTLILNDLSVQYRTTPSAGWSLLRRYQFNYEQSPSNTAVDPVSGLFSGVAGSLLLTQFSVLGADNTTTLPPHTFTYTNPETEYYEDVSYGAVGTPQAPLDRYLNASIPDHWVTTGSVTGGYALEQTLGYIPLVQVPNSQGLYGCITGSDHFVSTDPNCEGKTRINLEGYVYSSAPPVVVSAAIYRCRAGSDHFVSRDANCEGQTVEYKLGYVTTYASTNCGFSWNSSCSLFGMTLTNQYLATADNGEGLVETFQWDNARNNSHEVEANMTLTAPLSCNGHEGDGYPCSVVDDRAWSNIVLTERTSSVKSATNSGDVTSGWTYNYYLTQLTAHQCVDCMVGMYWGDANDGDYLDYYNMQFRGFALTSEYQPDSSLTNHFFYTTEGIGVYDTAKVGVPLPAGQQPTAANCTNPYKQSNGQQYPCANDPAWDVANAASGREYQTDTYGMFNAATQSWPLLRRTQTTFSAHCPAIGVATTPASSQGYGDWDTHLVAELDPSNPAAVCDIQQTNTMTLLAEGQSSPTTNNSAETQTATVYNANQYQQEISATTTGDDLSTTPTTVTTHDYIWDDAIVKTGAVPVGTYIVDAVADTIVRDGNNTEQSCTYNYYDGNTAFTGGQSSTLTQGHNSRTDQFANCSTQTPVSETTKAYNTNGDLVAATDPDGNAGITGHVGCTIGTTTYTSCTAYDSTFGFLPVTQSNSFNQHSSVTYGAAAGGAETGLWPTSSSDANGQTTSMTYDVLGRPLQTTAPGETAGWTSQMAYTVTCPAAGGTTLPCLEEDVTQRLDATTTVTKRGFFDGMGRLIETRTPSPSGQDAVQYVQYDNALHQVFASQPFFVPSGTGYYTPTGTEVHTSTTYDGMGRVISVTDPNSAVTTTSYTSACAIAGTSDLACYVATTVIDANQHKSVGYTDALGRSIFAQSFTGNGTYTLYRTTKALYDVLGDTIETDYADGSHKATATYDALKRQTAFTDPDLGSYTLSYDPNGNLTSSVDPRGASGTLYLGYDGLNRNTWKSTNSNGSNPLSTAAYDSTTSGNQGIGRVTSETFASGPSQSVTGSYAYVYDVRGQQTGSTMTLGTTRYPFTTNYNDAGQATSLTYPDGDVVTTSYGAQDWLSGVTEAKGGTTNTLLNTLSYTGANGASMLPTSAAVGNGVYTWNLSYDTDLRLKETKVQQVSNSTTLFDQTRAFDAVGNVTTMGTTLPAGTDNQVFCYDEQNRLVWSGSQGTPSCGGTLTPGTLNTGNVRYTQTYAYDVLNRLTTGPKGTGYTYGDTNHLDAVTAAPSYTASYDAAGSMTGRSGNVLGYNALRQLITWQNQATSPTQTASYAYNGSGERVQQSVTSGGATTTTSYIGAYEEVSVTGGTTTTTKYYSAGLATVVNVNGTLTYLVADTLGSVSASLTAAGGVQATELYSPYGSVRYSSGTMPTSYGYTKQRQDPSGLNYDHARYYDASVGQFISADIKQGQNRYGYVAGNPETNTDPTGQRVYTPCDGESASDCTPYKKPTTPQYPPPCTQNCDGGNPHPCGGTYTPAECNTYATQKQGTVSSIRNRENLKFALGLLGSSIADAFFLWADRKTGGLKWWSDLIGIAGDVLQAATYVLDFFQQNGGNHGGLLGQIQYYIAVASKWVNWAAGALISFSHSIWANWLADAAKAGLQAAGNGANPLSALWTGLVTAVNTFVPSIGNIVNGFAQSAQDAITHIVNGWVADDEAQADAVTNMSIDEYCKAYTCK